MAKIAPFRSIIAVCRTAIITAFQPVQSTEKQVHLVTGTRITRWQARINDVSAALFASAAGKNRPLNPIRGLPRNWAESVILYWAPTAVVPVKIVKISVNPLRSIRNGIIKGELPVTPNGLDAVVSHVEDGSPSVLNPRVFTRNTTTWHHLYLAG